MSLKVDLCGILPEFAKLLENNHMDTNQGIDELPENAGICADERTMGGQESDSDSRVFVVSRTLWDFEMPIPFTGLCIVIRLLRPLSILRPTEDETK